MKKQQTGSILISLLVIVALMVGGYYLISYILETDEAQDLQSGVETTVDSVNNVREQVDETKQAAEEAVESTTDFIDSVTP